MKRHNHKVILFTGLPRQSWYWVFAAILVSLLLHILSITELPDRERHPLLAPPKIKPSTEKVTVNVVKKKLAVKKTEPSEKILEAPLAPTEAPTAPSRLGAQDHIAEKETKISNLLPRPKAADPGQLGRDLKSEKAAPKQKQIVQAPKPPTLTPEKSEQNKKIIPQLVAPDGTVMVPQKDKMKPRNSYEALIPTPREMTQQMAAGYQDYVEDEVDVGDKVDLNTTNFRFIGYFTSIRKAFELVWSYPSEAVRRGLQGEVQVEFTIQKDGKLSRVKVVESSGHKILDDAVTEALRLASPFGPLPSGLKKDHLTVVGSFRYVLTNYAGGP